MVDQVPADQIETIVGVERHRLRHYARAVSAERCVYILHSQICVEKRDDLRACPLSLALNNGIDQNDWVDALDRPVMVSVDTGRLVPLRA